MKFLKIIQQVGKVEFSLMPTSGLPVSELPIGTIYPEHDPINA